MDKELLMLYGARRAVSKMQEESIICTELTNCNRKRTEITYSEIYNYLTKKINRHKEKVRKRNDSKYLRNPS